MINSSVTLKQIYIKDIERVIRDIHEIYMNKDVNPFMAFELCSVEKFRPILEKMLTQSQFYAIQNDAGKIVAVRRLILGEGHHAHIAYFASMGVHPDYRKQGYGNLLKIGLDKIIVKQAPHTKFIKISQESDNAIARYLALRQGWIESFYLPDWLIRTTGKYKNKPYVGERFLFYYLDKKFLKATTIPNKIPPSCLPEEPLKDCGKLEVAAIPYTRVEHVMEVNPEQINETNPVKLKAMLYWTALSVSNIPGKKKLECTVPENNIILISSLANVGFQYQGFRRGGYKLGDKYLNELVFDMSFFNINDAYKIINTCELIDVASKTDYKDKLARLEHCTKHIPANPLAKIIMQNLAYQLVSLLQRQKEKLDFINWKKDMPAFEMIDVFPENHRIFLRSMLNDIKSQGLDEFITLINELISQIETNLAFSLYISEANAHLHTMRKD